MGGVHHKPTGFSLLGALVGGCRGLSGDCRGMGCANPRHVFCVWVPLFGGSGVVGGCSPFFSKRCLSLSFSLVRGGGDQSAWWVITRTTLVTRVRGLAKSSRNPRQPPNTRKTRLGRCWLRRGVHHHNPRTPDKYTPVGVGSRVGLGLCGRSASATDSSPRRRSWTHYAGAWSTVRPGRGVVYHEPMTTTPRLEAVAVGEEVA